MKIDPVALGFSFADEWRRRELGKKLMRKLFPRIMARRDANRAARKAARQQPADELAEDFNQPAEVPMQLPQNTLRKGGIAVASFGPMLSIGLKLLGIGECTPEALEMGCVGAAEISGALVTLVGGGMYWIGRNRAAKRGE